jgi:pyridoxal phosphate enzyme (YggS family)
MAINKQAYHQITEELKQKNVTLVAVSKTKPVNDILELYQLGQRDFGENYVQELVDKAGQLPKDIRWHFIGHLQTNKVKYIVPFVSLIHVVDSLKLLTEINKQAEKNKRTIACLLQMHIASEETKFGLDEAELSHLVRQFADVERPHIEVSGLMGMASFTDNMDQVRNEFRELKRIFDEYSASTVSGEVSEQFRLSILSMGMSSDYKIAIEEGSTMVRIGSLLFGARVYDE